MADIIAEEVKFPEEMEWRKTLPEVFRPVAERYGKHRFSVAWNTGAVQEALTGLAGQLQRNQQLMHAVMFASSAANQLAFYALESQGMTHADLREIQLDIERAAALGAASRQPEGGGRLIIPS